jgi:hypothetical protein
MRKLAASLIFPFSLALVPASRLLAQIPASAPAVATAAAKKTSPAAQAPDDVMKKLSDLVHAGKYSEAQQLTAGLLLAYPEDPRLIKGQALIEKLLSPAPTSGQPAQSATSANAKALTGMDKVNFSALLELARQAQETTDVSQQKTLLQQFMDQSDVFLRKHPAQMLLWQLRAVSAISLNDPRAGYDAGQKLIAAGAADSADPNLLRLLAQLKNKGWLDKQSAEQQAAEIGKYSWVIGTWGLHFSRVNQRGQVTVSGDEKVEFSRDDSLLLAYIVSDGGVKEPKPRMRGTMLDSGEIRWEIVHSPGWQPVLTCDIASDKKTVTVSFPVILPNKKGQETATWFLHKN